MVVVVVVVVVVMITMMMMMMDYGGEYEDDTETTHTSARHATTKEFWHGKQANTWQFSSPRYGCRETQQSQPTQREPPLCVLP